MIHICHRGYQHYVLGLVPRSRFRRKRFAPFFLRHAPYQVPLCGGAGLGCDNDFKKQKDVLISYMHICIFCIIKH